MSERSRKKSIETSSFVQNDYKVVPLNHEHRLDRAVEEQMLKTLNDGQDLRSTKSKINQGEAKIVYLPYLIRQNNDNGSIATP